MEHIYSILLAEENEQDRRPTREIIRDRPPLYLMVELRDNGELLSCLMGETPFQYRRDASTHHVVILDEDLPHCRTSEILLWLRSHLANQMRVFVITGSLDFSPCGELQQAGAEVCFMKPANLKELIATVKRIEHRLSQSAACDSRLGRTERRSQM